MENNTSWRKKVAVISESRETADFFALEARAWGCRVDIFSIAHAELTGYDVIILDTAHSGSAEQTHGRVIRLVYSEDEVTDEDTWEMPVPLERVRSLLLGGGQERTGESETDNGRTIYLIDGDPRHIVYNNKRIELTEREALVLSALTESKGIVRRSELEALFGVSEGNICDVYVCHLRKKLESPLGVKLISTVRGEGYSFIGEVKTQKRNHN